MKEGGVRDELRERKKMGAGGGRADGERDVKDTMLTKSSWKPLIALAARATCLSIEP